VPSGAAPQLVKGPFSRCLDQEPPDRERAFAWTAGAGVALEVVKPVLVHEWQLCGCLAGDAVTAGFFAPFQLVWRAVNANEDDVQAFPHVQAVLQPPRLAQHVVDHDVVARLSHSGHRSVEPRPRAAQNVSELGSVQFERPFHGAQGPDGVHTQVEVRGVQNPQQLRGDARLAGAGRPVEEDDQRFSLVRSVIDTPGATSRSPVSTNPRLR
jgi:hypothetical protein